MGKRTSKDLLQLEHKNPSTSSPESSLLVCKNDSLVDSQRKKSNSDEKLTTTSVPQSQVLGKVKDFLGVLSEANKRLQLDAKESSQNYDIEALTGDESQVIEMDLTLGIADLYTPEAVAAAESVISGYQPVIPLASSSSETKSEDSSDEDDESDDDDNDEDDDAEEQDGKTSSTKLKRSKSAKDNSSSEVGNSNSKKRPKIIELL